MIEKHEALIREWKRLRDWLDESREDVRLQRLLSASATEWVESNRDSSFLLRGGRLLQFEDWINTTTVALTGDERAYVEASIDERLREEEEERIRAEQQKRLERRGRLLLRFIVFVLVLAAIGASILSFFIFQQSQQAFIARETSDANAVTAVFAATNAAFANETSVANAQIAEENALAAETSAAEALDAQETAVVNEQAAVAAQAAAQENEATAIAAQDVAVRQAEEAQSLALAASARQLIENNSPLALALAIEANNVPDPSLQAQQVLISVVYNAPRRFLQNNNGSFNDLLLLPDTPSTEESCPENEDCSLLYTANGDGTITLWQVNNPEPLQIISGHTDTVTSLALSPDGRMLASGSSDNTVRVWDTETGENLFVLTGHENTVNTVTFRSNRQLASGSDDTTIIIWNLNDGSISETIDSGPTAINHIEFSPSGRYIAVAFEDALRLWDTSRNQFFAFTEDPESTDIQISRVRYATFSADGLFVLSSGDATSGTPQLWDISTPSEPTLVREFPTHNGPVNSVAFSPDGQFVISASDDFSLILSEQDTGEFIRQLNAHQSRVTDVSFTSDSNFILSTSGGGGMFLWDTTPAAQFQNFESHDDGVSNILYTPEGQLLTGAYDGTFRFWNPDNASLLEEFNIGRPPIPQTTFLFRDLDVRENATVLWGATDMRLISLFDGSILQSFLAIEERAWLQDIAISPDGTKAIWAGGYFFRDELITFTRAGLLIMWDTETGEVIRYFGEDLLTPSEGNDISATAVDFSPDGQTIVAGLENGTLLTWDVDTGELVQEFDGHSDQVTEIQFNEMGNLVLTGAADRAIILWQVENGQILRRFIGHTGRINDVEFSPDELTIISGAEDTRIIVWDLVTGQALRVFDGHDAPVISVAFSPDAEFALSGDLLGNLIQWRIESPETLKEWAAINRYIPEFTRPQCEQFQLASCGEISTNDPESSPVPDSAAIPDTDEINAKAWIAVLGKSVP